MDICFQHMAIVNLIKKKKEKNGKWKIISLNNLIGNLKNYPLTINIVKKLCIFVYLKPYSQFHTQHSAWQLYVNNSMQYYVYRSTENCAFFSKQSWVNKWPKRSFLNIYKPEHTQSKCLHSYTNTCFKICSQRAKKIYYRLGWFLF